MTKSSVNKSQYLTRKKHNFPYAAGASDAYASNRASSQNRMTDQSIEQKAMEADHLDQIGNDLLLNLKDQLSQMRQTNDENNRVLYDQFLDQHLHSHSSLFQNSRREQLSQKSLNFISPTFNSEMVTMFQH